jgi:hypothetical protein
MTDKCHESIDRLADAVSEINLIKQERRSRSPLGPNLFRFTSEVFRLIYQKIIVGFNAARAYSRVNFVWENAEIRGYTKQLPFFSLSYIVGSLVGRAVNLFVD